MSHIYIVFVGEYADETNIATFTDICKAKKLVHGLNEAYRSIGEPETAGYEEVALYSKTPDPEAFLSKEERCKLSNQ